MGHEIDFFGAAGINRRRYGIARQFLDRRLRGRVAGAFDPVAFGLQGRFHQRKGSLGSREPVQQHHAFGLCDRRDAGRQQE